MATITLPRATPEDLLEIRDRPMPELVDGELVERGMGNESDAIAAMMVHLLLMFVVEHGLGRVNTSQGAYQIFPDDPKKVRVPDGSFVRRERLPVAAIKGHCRVVPDLVFEVVSPNDGAVQVEEKVDDFLSVGVPLIWVIYPETRAVQVYRQSGIGQRLKPGDILDGEDVLPGFKCPVSVLFEN